jgi:hypothetical protein
VYCQPIEYRHLSSGPGALDLQAANAYAWQPDYAAVDLAAVPDSWRSLAPPRQCFCFDFNCADPQRAFQASEAVLEFTALASGCLNAVAFWFELQLSADACLSSSPYQDARGTTWHQVSAAPWLGCPEGLTLAAPTWQRAWSPHCRRCSACPAAT